MLFIPAWQISILVCWQNAFRGACGESKESFVWKNGAITDDDDVVAALLRAPRELLDALALHAAAYESRLKGDFNPQRFEDFGIESWPR
jgi:hypothetical protein